MHISKDLPSCTYVFVRRDAVKKPLQQVYDGPYKVLGQGLIDPRSGERACNSTYACRDGNMLVVTKNRTKRVGGWQRQLCSLR